MLRNMFLVAISVLIALNLNAQSNDSKKSELKFNSKLDSVAYVIGQNIGMSLKRDALFINLDLFKAGVNDALNLETSVIPMEEMQRIMTEFQQEMQEKQMAEQQKQQEEQKKIAEQNKAKEAEFFKENSKKAGIVTTQSGLQYKVVKDAKGAKPKATDKVKVHYVGKLLDGTEFDSSVKRNEPLEITLNQVIPGWTEGVQLMSIGSKYTFWIPADLGYGDQGAGELIPPGSTLVFEVELLEILP